MTEPTRQLAAIMFTDIVGYTALMGKDSAKALELVRTSKDIQKPLVEKHNGKWLKEMGDGAMAQFSTALDAVNCSIEIQEIARGKLDAKLRIGIHLGDVTMEEDDVHGDGVNVAARLESIADPGGIYVSDAIEKAIRGQSDVQAKLLGEVSLKNVDYGVKTYALQGVGLPVPEVKEEKELSGRFIAELQRRGVIRAGLTYIVAGILLILLLREGQSWISLPEWSLKAVVIALIAGLPVAIYLAWNYERSPEGFVRTSSQQSWQNPYSDSQKKPLTGRIVIAVLALAVIFLYFFPQRGGSGTIDPDRAKTIAVLPFKNLSSDPETQYFVDGIMDVILSNLARIGDLKVTSRTSVEQYRDRQPKPTAPQIGKELNVNYLVEASVQRFGDRMKITIQLIDAIEDKHIWAEDYDRKWTDILQLESDLSLQIAEQLQARISDPEIQTINTAHATDPVAHDFLLKGNEFLARSFDNKQDLEFAQLMYENALEIDPNYALGWYGLGNAKRNLYHFYHERSSEQKREVKEAFDKALALNPDLMEAQLGQALYFYSCELDYETSIGIIEELLAKYPGSADLTQWLGLSYRRERKFEKAEEYLADVTSLEPTYWQNWVNYGQILAWMGKYDQAELAYNRAIALNPGASYSYLYLSRMKIDRNGDLQGAREMMDHPFLMESYPTHWISMELLDRNYQAAIDRWNLLPDEGISNQSEYTPKSLSLALIYYLAGNDSAQALFEESIDPLLAKIKETPEDERPYVSLGLAYAGLGEKQKAIEAGERAVQILNISKDALQGASREGGLMTIYIMVGEYDLSIQLIRKFLNHWPVNGINYLKLHPMYDPLRDLPEFQAILKDPKYQISL